MDEFQVDRTDVALVVSLTLFTSSCLAPILGNLIDRFPLKIIICAGAGWMGIGYLLLRHVDSYTGFFIVLVCFQGVAWGTVGPLMQTKLMVNWFSRNRGMALGIAIMGISVAGIVMPTVATFLSESIGWRDTYGLYSLSIFVVLIPMTLWLVKQDPSVIGQYPDGDAQPPTAGKAAPVETDKGLVKTYKQFLTSKAFWSVVLTFGLMNGVYSAMITHLPAYLTRELNYGMYDASIALGVAGGFAIAGKIVFGWLMDHFDARLTVLFAVTSYFASTIVFILVDQYWLLLVAAGLFGLGFGGMVPVRSVLLSRMFGAAKFSRVNGLLAFFLAPATFWVLLTGYLADTYGTYTVAFQVWAVSFFLAGIISSIVTLPNVKDAIR